MDRARGIAKDGDMPWHLPGDLAFFAKLTTGKGCNVVIMGRKTWDTIPQRFRPLPGRGNVVVTRQTDFDAPGAETASSLDQALEAAAAGTTDQVFVIGGAQIYQEALRHPACRDVHVTEIDQDFGCQVFFPALDGFVREEILGEEEHLGLCYRFTRWRRA